MLRSLAKLQFRDEEKPHIDDAFEELTEGEEQEGRENWTIQVM